MESLEIEDNEKMLPQFTNKQLIAALVERHERYRSLVWPDLQELYDYLESIKQAMDAIADSFDLDANGLDPDEAGQHGETNITERPF